MSNSKRKMRVTVTSKTPYNKQWAVVEFTDWRTGNVKASWIPSFEDLHRIAQAIAYCEEKKYPSEKGYKGARFVEEFLVDAVREPDFEKLARKYKIPIRCGTNVVDTNGANLDES